MLPEYCLIKVEVLRFARGYIVKKVWNTYLPIAFFVIFIYIQIQQSVQNLHPRQIFKIPLY
jgi:hypothetical protein